MSPPRRVSRATRRVLAAALYFSGVVSILRRLQRGNPRPLILRYHSVGGGRGLRRALVVSERHFASHMRYLHRSYPVVPLERLVALMEAGQPPTGAVAITFDDGYRDNHDIALPILQRYCCPATVFVVVESVQSGVPPWPQRLFLLLRSAKTSEVRVSWEGPRSGQWLDARFDLGTPEAREATYRALKAVAAALEADERAALLQRIAEAAGHGGHVGADTAPAMLRWDQIRELGRQGISIGSHTMTHPRLTSLDPERAELELVESRVTLESVLGFEVSLFAYPFGTPGDFDAETRHAVMKAGYRAACTTIEGAAGPEADPFGLRRLKIRDEPVWMFAARLLAAGRSSRLLTWIIRDQ